MKNQPIFLIFIFLITACLPQQQLKLMPSVEFYALPETIDSDQETRLYWKVTNLQFADVKINSYEDNLPLIGSQKLQLKSDMIYTIRVNSGTEFIYTKDVKITVNQVPVIELSATAENVEKGKPIDIIWNVANINGEIITLNGKIVSESKGKTTIYPVGTQTIVLETTKNGKMIRKKEIVVSTYDPSINTNKNKRNVVYSQGPDDGRFTIGGNNKRLMYGYPVPQSTSHFVLSVDDMIASNNPKFENSEAVTFISGKMITLGALGSIYNEITYLFDNVKITQRMIPQTTDGTQTNVNEFGQYYKIQYEIENLANTPKRIGLMCVTDYMINNNDAAQVIANGNPILIESEIPLEGDKTDIVAYELLGNLNFTASRTCFEIDTKPDHAYVGRWSNFYNTTTELSLSNQPYGDSGMLLKWDSYTIAPNQKKIFAYRYGLPNGGEINAITTMKIEESKSVIYFPTGSSILSKSAKQTIDSLLAVTNKEIVGALIGGFADAQGDEILNYKLSQKRISSTVTWLKKRNITNVGIIPKPYGETEAKQDDLSQKKGNISDRKVEVIIFTRSN